MKKLRPTHPPSVLPVWVHDFIHLPLRVRGLSTTHSPVQASWPLRSLHSARGASDTQPWPPALSSAPRLCPVGLSPPHSTACAGAAAQPPSPRPSVLPSGTGLPHPQTLLMGLLCVKGCSCPLHSRGLSSHARSPPPGPPHSHLAAVCLPGPYTRTALGVGGSPQEGPAEVGSGGQRAWRRQAALGSSLTLPVTGCVILASPLPLQALAFLAVKWASSQRV